jgi:hypothetical protein
MSDKNANLSINILALCTFCIFFVSCQTNYELPEVNERIVGVYQGDLSSQFECGAKIKVISGIELAKALDYESKIRDSSFYASSVPLLKGDTFEFSCRKLDPSEYFSCSQGGISGYRQIKLIEIIKKL